MSACTSRPRLGRFGWPGRGRRVGGLIAVPATRRQHPGECPGWPVPAGWRNEGLRDRRCRRRHGLRPWPAKQWLPRRRHDGHACGGRVRSPQPGTCAVLGGCPGRLVLGRRRGRDRFTFRFGQDAGRDRFIPDRTGLRQFAARLSVSWNAPGLNEAGLNGDGLSRRTGHYGPGLNGDGLSRRTGHYGPGLNGDGLSRRTGHYGPGLNGDGLSRRAGFHQVCSNRRGFDGARLHRARLKRGGFNRVGLNRGGFDRAAL